MTESVHINSVEHITKTLIAFVAEESETGAYLHTEELTPDTAYDSIDFDSLVLVELALELQRRFGVPITHDELTSAATVRGTAELLTRRGVRTDTTPG